MSFYYDWSEQPPKFAGGIKFDVNGITTVFNPTLPVPAVPQNTPQGEIRDHGVYMHIEPAPRAKHADNLLHDRFRLVAMVQNTMRVDVVKS